MRIVISSASGANGDGYGTILAFDLEGDPLGRFCGEDDVVDPRGLCVAPSGDLLHANSGDDRIVALDGDGRVVRASAVLDGLDPGGGTFGPDRRYYVGSRRLRTVMALPAGLDGPADAVLAPGVVPFPRGFALSADGHLFPASGMGPSGVGEETIKVFAPDGTLVVSRLVDDPQLSPLDLTLAPNGNIVVSSEWPFGAVDAASSVREYDRADGHLVRVFEPDRAVGFRNPRGLRFGPDGHLYCVSRDDVVSFDFDTGTCLGTTVHFPRLFGQALAFLD